MAIVKYFVSILMFINNGDFCAWQDVIGFLIVVIAVVVEVKFEIGFVVVFVGLNIIVVIDIVVVGYKIEVVD